MTAFLLVLAGIVVIGIVVPVAVRWFIYTRKSKGGDSGE